MVRVGKDEDEIELPHGLSDITFGVDVLDRHMKIRIYNGSIILIIMLIVFVQIIYYSFFKRE